MGGNYTCEWHIKSDPALVPPLVRELLEHMQTAAAGVSREEHGDIRLMLHELLYNAVIHGNGSDEGKYVHVRLAIRQRVLYVSILDEGPGFDAKAACAENGADKESGRGMRLVSGLADEVSYSHSGRQVTFAKKIGARHG